MWCELYKYLSHLCVEKKKSVDSLDFIYNVAILAHIMVHALKGQLVFGLTFLCERRFKKSKKQNILDYRKFYISLITFILIL